MAFDFIDMIVNTGDEYLTGVFYKRRPVSPTDIGVTFKYKQLDPNARVFDKVLGELRKDRETYAIKTNDDCEFNIGGYIQTQNGKAWEITEVIGNEEVEGGNEALRWFKTAKNAEISVRMIQVDDLYGVQDTYDKNCVIYIESDQKILDVVYGTSVNPVPVNGYVYKHTIKKGTSLTLTIIFEMGKTKTLTIPASKTILGELKYKVSSK